MKEQIQHPEIAWYERTGYPSYAQPDDHEPQIYCQECGKNLTNKTVYEDEKYEYLCDECLLFFHEKP